jgi:hypothetical protein
MLPVLLLGLSGCGSDERVIQLETVLPFVKGRFGTAELNFREQVDPVRVITLKYVLPDTAEPGMYNATFGTSFIHVDDTGATFRLMVRADFQTFDSPTLRPSDALFQNLFYTGFYSNWARPDAPVGLRVFFRIPNDSSLYLTSRVVQPAESSFRIVDLIRYRRPDGRAAAKMYVQMRCLMENATGQRKIFDGEVVWDIYNL